MSILRRGTETVTVYPEESFTDDRGETRTRPAADGLEAKATIQPISSTENQDGGVNTVQVCRLRLVDHPDDLGPRSQMEWNGERWAIEGKPLRYNGSPRTRHTVSMIKRF